MNNPPRADVVSMGIDPGVSPTGYAIFKGSMLIAEGKIATSPKLPEPLRYIQIKEGLSGLIRSFGVTEVSLEHFYAFYTNDPSSSGDTDSPLLKLLGKGSKRRFKHDRSRVNPRSMFLLKGAQTVAQLAALENNCSLYLYTVGEWKGNARLSKEDIKERVRLIFKKDIKDHNINDAIMIGHYHCSQGWMKSSNGISVGDAITVLPKTAIKK